MNVLQIFYLMIPAYVANMVPVLVRKIPWNTPMDFNLSLKGKRVLGSHKTWRGFVFGIIISSFVMYLLSLLYWPFNFSVFSWSILASGGALIGDAVESFFKRRLNIKSGESWFPFDQIDFTVGALVFGSFVFFPGWAFASVVVLVSIIGHIIVNHSAYFLGIRSQKW